MQTVTTIGFDIAKSVFQVHGVDAARADQMNKLGAAGPQRIEAIETWLAAKVGDKANIAIATLKQYPIAANVEMFETIIRLFSSQGGTNFTQSGRDQAEEPGKIPGYSDMNFVQRRISQMSGGPRGKGDGR